MPNELNKLRNALTTAQAALDHVISTQEHIATTVNPQTLTQLREALAAAERVLLQPR